LAVILNTDVEDRSVSLTGKWESFAFETIPGAGLRPGAGTIQVRMPPLAGVVVD